MGARRALLVLRFVFAGSVFAGIVFAPAASVVAQEAATVTCKDGSSSKGGKGACSHHGGVAKGEPSTPAPMNAPPRNDNATPPAATQRPSPAPSRSAPSRSTAAPGKPTAKCKDGSLSYSVHHSGACSHHGGVNQWLDGS